MARSKNRRDLCVIAMTMCHRNDRLQSRQEFGTALFLHEAKHRCVQLVVLLDCSIEDVPQDVSVERQEGEGLGGLLVSKPDADQSILDEIVVAGKRPFAR